MRTISKTELGIYFALATGIIWMLINVTIHFGL